MLITFWNFVITNIPKVTQNSEIVFLDPVAWIPDELDKSLLQVLDAVEVIVNSTIET